MKRLLAILLLILLAAPVSATDRADRPITVSMIQLLATPERYEGKEVQVAGFVELGFESTVLYLHREDRNAGLRQNSLWISQDSAKVAKEHAQLNLQYVELRATFSSKRKGHMGLYPATLSGIKWMERVPGT